MIKKIFLYLLGVFYITAGVMHFVNTDFYVQMMPNILPYKLELVYLSGVIESALGILVLIPKYRRLAAFGIMVLLVAVFPANINVALNPDLMPGVSTTMLWLRLPLQGLLLWWAYFYTKPTISENA